MGNSLFRRVLPLWGAILVCLLILTPSTHARQIVTLEDRSWAKEALQQEKELAKLINPNTVAVLYFKNNTGLMDLDILQKGICIMLTTDLGKIKGLQVLERAKLQALIDEMRLSASGFVEAGTATQIGRILQAEHLIGGDILKEPAGWFRLQSDLLKVSTESVFDRPTTKGELLEGIFQMEKDLLFKIVDALEISLSPEEEEALQQHITSNLDALLNLFQGIELSDQGRYEEAKKFLEDAMEEDPDFWLARSILEELQDVILTYPEGYSEPEAAPEPPVAEDSQAISDQEDPRDRDLSDIDNDGDGYTENENDCDDTNPSIHPGSLDIPYDGIDQDCSGQDLTDVDGDGFDAIAAGGNDCNDNDPNINPGAQEIAYDGIDQDCSGQDLTDVDGDGFDAIAAGGNDCNDNDPNVNPGQAEVCNGADENCNGEIDEGFDQDADGYTSCGGDCNDDDFYINPDAQEICDGQDNNCDGQVDEGVLITYWVDADDDGYGDPASPIQTCDLIGGLVANDLDCNDNNAQQYPGAGEICGNNLDDDCDGIIDDGCEYLTGVQPPLVDIGSVNLAEGNMNVDSGLSLAVNNGDYEPGHLEAASNAWGFAWTGNYATSYDWSEDDAGQTYSPGLQLLGKDSDDVIRAYVNPDTLERINQDPFLAYAVQVEEDRLNREILEMKRRAWASEQLDDIISALESNDIRTRDDYLMQKADAQAGRVLMDKDGYWVRVQQYVLRHDHQNDAGETVTSIQVLNVNLRGSGPHAGLSTLDFTTNLMAQVQPEADLRQLPWDEWLNTQGPALPLEPDQRYVESQGGLESMYIQVTAPDGSFLREARTFSEVNDGRQIIESETLTIAMGTALDGTYTYTSNWLYAQPDEYWVYPDGDFIYTPQGTNPAPFYYMYRYGPYSPDPAQDQIAPLVMMDLFVVGDADTADNIGVSGTDYSDVAFSDIWDCMRVNGADDSLWIGENNLEMAFKPGWSNDAAIDIVFIPLSRMIWRADRILYQQYYFWAGP